VGSTGLKAELSVQQSVEWWRGAVIYQIYPRSFLDSSGDGVGDLKGITEKLDYVAALGVDAIWISPFFKSPMKDFGYDISDYRAVDPLFGDLYHFDQLIARAHDLGLRVMIDQVLSHTSDQHAWFEESRSSRDNAKSDWYVWADPSEDGGVPNNWLSIFGGSAWQWDERREQYYLHNFLTSQPDLNFHNDALRQRLLQEVEFWLQRGVDGIRFDAINFCYHDRSLRDNPMKPEHERVGRGYSPDNPYAAQYHYYDNSQPENLQFLESLRALLDRYPDTVSLGEINSEFGLKTMDEYTGGNSRLHMAYSFELLADEFSAAHIRTTVERFARECPSSWPCWSVGNHDVARVVTRWGSQASDKAHFAKTIMAMLTALRGSLCLYQGEELGLSEADLEFEQLQDPFGIAFWPEFKGRDGCRTPMPWQPEVEHFGFSTSAPWLPMPKEHGALSVANQADQRDSVLNFYRSMLELRGRSACLRWGDLAFLAAPEGVLAIERRLGSDAMVFFVNLTAAQQTLSRPAELTDQLTVSDGALEFLPAPQRVDLDAFSFMIATNTVALSEKSLTVG
jgi:alpha-glucosidase